MRGIGNCQDEIQKVILLSVSAMLASNEDFRKSMTFLIPGVKLVVKTFPSESFSRMEQLKSLDEIWKRYSSERVCTNLAFFLMLSWRFSTFRIFSIRVNSCFTTLTGSDLTSTIGSGITSVTGSGTSSTAASSAGSV
ncbi:MAG: hypothetical protein NTW16_00040 [Bacteroidetes bacterium]|nr:hypothetical protein [Bacteroidota bacterium]